MKPQDFLLGIRDLFAIIIPGAAVLILFGIDARLESIVTSNVAGVDIFAFVIAAYAAGSIATATGALFDGWVTKINEKAKRRASHAAQMTNHVTLATRFRDHIASAAAGSDEFDWKNVWSSKAFWLDQLRLNCTPAVAELDRLESIQKLFRSLMVVFVASIAAWLVSILVTAPGNVPTLTIVGHPDFIYWGLAATAICAFFYAFNRWRHDAAVYRLAVAFMIAPRVQKAANDPLPEAWRDLLADNPAVSLGETQNC